MDELDLIIGPHYVITHDPGGLVDEVRAEVERSPRLLQKGPAWVAHAILDAAVDRYMPLIDNLDGEIERWATTCCARRARARAHLSCASCSGSSACCSPCAA